MPSLENPLAKGKALIAEPLTAKQRQTVAWAFLWRTWLLSILANTGAMFIGLFLVNTFGELDASPEVSSALIVIGHNVLCCLVALPVLKRILAMKFKQFRVVLQSKSLNSNGEPVYLPATWGHVLPVWGCFVWVSALALVGVAGLMFGFGLIAETNNIISYAGAGIFPACAYYVLGKQFAKLRIMAIMENTVPVGAPPLLTTTRHSLGKKEMVTVGFNKQSQQNVTPEKPIAEKVHLTTAEQAFASRHEIDKVLNVVVEELKKQYEARIADLTQMHCEEKTRVEKQHESGVKKISETLEEAKAGIASCERRNRQLSSLAESLKAQLTKETARANKFKAIVTRSLFSVRAVRKVFRKVVVQPVQAIVCILADFVRSIYLFTVRLVQQHVTEKFDRILLLTAFGLLGVISAFLAVALMSHGLLISIACVLVIVTCSSYIATSKR
jgi:hypothetical protein